MAEICGVTPFIPATVARASRSRTGFTLVELLVVIGIIALLMGLLVPAVQSVREASRRSVCLNNMRQIGIAANSYNSANSVFPPSVEDVNQNTDQEANWAWSARLLPQLDMMPAYTNLLVDVHPLDTMRLAPTDTRFDSFRAAAQGTISTFMCPSGDPTTNSQGVQMSRSFEPTTYPRPWAYSNYAACHGVSLLSMTWGWPESGLNSTQLTSNRKPPMPPVRGHSAAAIVDGLSNTFMAGEVFPWNASPPFMDGYTGVNWLGIAKSPGNGRHASYVARSAAYPINSVAGTYGRGYCFGSGHAGGGGTFVFFDGSTRFIDDTIQSGSPAGSSFPVGSYGVYQKLGDRNDRQPIEIY